jgi:signal transduction histidine kinase
LTLKRKIFLRVSGLQAAMILAVTVLTCIFVVKYRRASTMDIFSTQLELLADRAEGLVLWDDRLALSDLLDGTVREHQVVEYAFIERQGRPYVHTFEKGIPKALLGLPSGSSGTPMVRTLANEQEQRIFDLATPVGEEKAVLHLGLSSEEINRQSLPHVISVIVLGFAAILVGIIMSKVITGLITREVDQSTSNLRAEISERKRAEEELARYHDHLEELVRQRTRQLEESQEKIRQAERLASLGTFAAGIAHEINNPLASILMTARHALKLEQDRGDANEPLEEIIEDTERCARIVKGVLQFARQEPSEKSSVNLNLIIQRTANQIRKYSQQQGVNVELKLSDDIPLIEADPTRLEQAFVNIINNAIEASSEGQQVVIYADKVSDIVRIRVRDHGRGMTDEEKQHAFDPFFTTRTKEGGTGLGLSMVHGTITEHKGKIKIDTKPDHGTTVSIEFPFVSSPSDIEVYYEI